MPAETLVSAIVPIAYIALSLGESRIEARGFPAVRFWKLTGAVFFIVLLAISLLAPFVIPIEWLEAHRVFDLSGMGLWGVGPALLTISFVTYWLHRAEHHFTWLWRGMHQLHHSALRVDIAGACFTHPTEMMVKITIGATVSVPLLGLTPVAAATASAIAALLSMFQHWNVTTPRWLGFLVQRPESHCLHHEYGVHARNYGDLPLWDIIFGTFANPRSFDGHVGFEEAASRRVGAMLLMRDVNAPPTAAAGARAVSQSIKAVAE